ncbi:MAG: hypothetical protein PHC53_04155 [Patescibacteria group bacterium]|nr:hypothetical protein [Patescibacteria group bacterium]
MTTTRKNTARSQDIRGPHAPTGAKPAHLHLVSDKVDAKETTSKKCSCGKEIVGPHKTCGQCNLLAKAKINGQELYTCLNCSAQTPFNFCWNCHHTLSEQQKLTLVHAENIRERKETKPAVVETKTVEASAPAAQPEPSKTTVIETDDATIEYHEANGNELVIVRRVLAEIEEEEHAEEVQRQMEDARKAREAEAARVAEIRSLLRETCKKGGKAGLWTLGADIILESGIEVDGTKYTNPHFTARYQNVSCDFHDNEAADDIKAARSALADRLEAAAKVRREAEAAARRAKHAPKKDEPKPGKSGGKGKDAKNGKGKK